MTLLERVKAAAEAVATHKATIASMRKDVSATAMLSALAIEAFIAGEHDTIRDTLKTSETWAKGPSVTYSQAVTLAKYLRDGNTVPQGERKDPFIVNGAPVKVLSAEHVPHLAGAIAGDTTVPAIVKHAGAIKRARRAEADKAEATVSDTLAAFLRSADGKASYEGETPDTLLPRLMLNPAEYARVMQAGAAVLDAEAAAAAAVTATQDAEAFASSVLDYIAECGPAVLDLFGMAIEERRAMLAPAPEAEAIAA